MFPTLRVKKRGGREAKMNVMVNRTDNVELTNKIVQVV